MMEGGGGSLEPVVIKMPKDDVGDVMEELLMVELDEVVMDTFVFSQESRVVSKEAMSSVVVMDACEDGEHVESDDEEFVRCLALPMA
jgi:hypothetical protein